MTKHEAMAALRRTYERSGYDTVYVYVHRFGIWWEVIAKLRDKGGGYGVGALAFTKAGLCRKVRKKYADKKASNDPYSPSYP
jgi:hypothetical protein